MDWTLSSEGPLDFLQSFPFGFRNPDRHERHSNNAHHRVKCESSYQDEQESRLAPRLNDAIALYNLKLSSTTYTGIRVIAIGDK